MMCLRAEKRYVWSGHCWSLMSNYLPRALSVNTKIRDVVSHCVVCFKMHLLERCEWRWTLSAPQQSGWCCIMIATGTLVVLWLQRDSADERAGTSQRDAVTRRSLQWWEAEDVHDNGLLCWRPSGNARECTRQTLSNIPSSQVCTAYMYCTLLLLAHFRPIILTVTLLLHSYYWYIILELSQLTR